MEGISILTDDQVKDIQTIIQQMLAPGAGDKKISALDAIPAIAAGDLFAAVDLTDTTTKKATISQVKDWLEADQITFTYSTSTPSDYTLKTDTTLLADVDGIAGNVSEVTAYASGMDSANQLIGYRAILNRSASDVNGHYIGFKADDFAVHGGTSSSYGVWVGKNYDWGLYVLSGRILLNDDDPDVIACARETAGDGGSFTISAADGVASAAEARSGGDFYISSGAQVNAGTDGEIIFQIGGVDKAKFDSDGKLELATGTGCNEIVTGITAANTDDQLATAKAIYDAILELSHTQYEYFTATAGQTAFTIVGPTPLNAHAAQIVVQGIVYQYGAGNDFTISGNALTWINTNYTLQNGDIVQLWYDGPGSEAREWGSYSGTLPVAGATLVVTAAQLGLTDARQITDATLWGRGTDQNWYKAMNTWGGATHLFNFTIPTLADPNLGDLVIQVSGTATSIASQPFKLSFEYTSTNFLT